ncbi:MAG: T9SS type A sorting domain-containing protein [Bacteroidales bacterium]|nr:T9SS type A sorting domain-containing protein [Bacteroidales bacterium]
MKKTISLIFTLFYFLNVPAQTWTQLGNDIDGDAAGDFCGYSVSLSSDGSIMAVGSDWNSENGTRAGQVRVFENNSGEWMQLGNTLYGDAAYDLFGISLDISADGSILSVGASGHNGSSGYDDGLVRIYENNAGIWTQIGEDIDGEAQEDHSASSISLSADGSIIAIGANMNQENGTMSGHVRIYENNAGTWTQIGEDIDGEAASDLSGSKISLNDDGTIVAIGAHGNDGNGSGSGHVRVFENIAGTWTQMGQDIDGENNLDQSGTSVDLNSEGIVLAIGAIYNDGGGSNSGHVRVFQFNNDAWIQMGEDIDGQASEDLFGNAVGLNSDGSRIVIGARGDDESGLNAGQAKVFEYTNDAWLQIGENILGENSEDESGNAVSINSDGTIIAIGAYKNDGTGVDAGHVRVYKDMTTNIVSLNNNELSISPNPTNGIFTIDFHEAGKSNISITDISGKIILYENNADRNQIDMSNFENGIYLIRIQTAKKTFTTKIIKQ